MKYIAFPNLTYDFFKNKYVYMLFFLKIGIKEEDSNTYQINKCQFYYSSDYRENFGKPTLSFGRLQWVNLSNRYTSLDIKKYTVGVATLQCAFRNYF